MFKALLATAAVTVCCLGNDYPANSCTYGCSQQQNHWESPVVEGSDIRWQMQRMQQEIEYQRSLQRSNY